MSIVWWLALGWGHTHVNCLVAGSRKGHAHVYCLVAVTGVGHAHVNSLMAVEVECSCQ